MQLDNIISRAVKACRAGESGLLWETETYGVFFYAGSSHLYIEHYGLRVSFRVECKVIEPAPFLLAIALVKSMKAI